MSLIIINDRSPTLKHTSFFSSIYIYSLKIWRLRLGCLDLFFLKHTEYENDIRMTFYDLLEHKSKNLYLQKFDVKGFCLLAGKSREDFEFFFH